MAKLQLVSIQQAAKLQLVLMQQESMLLMVLEEQLVLIHSMPVRYFVQTDY